MDTSGVKGASNETVCPNSTAHCILLTHSAYKTAAAKSGLPLTAGIVLVSKHRSSACPSSCSVSFIFFSV